MDLLFLKLLQQANLGKKTAKHNLHLGLCMSEVRCTSFRRSQSTAGFTLLEILVAVVIIGILGAIAAPGWLAFMNTQRVNKANDIVLAALRDAQQQAKKSKLSYSVFFRENNNVPEFAVSPTKDGEGKDVEATNIKIWKPLGGDLEIKSGQLVVRTNLKADSTVDTTTASLDFKTPKKITFDQMGTLSEDQFKKSSTGTISDESPGPRVMVAVPKAGSPTEASDTKRCVIIQTLLGGMRTAKDEKCDKDK